jgi:hypothetical protein
MFTDIVINGHPNSILRNTGTNSQCSNSPSVQYFGNGSSIKVGDSLKMVGGKLVKTFTLLI